MKLEEYLEIVSEQIRYTKIRSTITEELKTHILDQAEDYEACGMFPKDALDRAIRDMGDPVETGVSLDRIHRPQMNWGIIVMIAVISILGLGILYTINIHAQGIFPWERQMSFVILGFLLMLLVCRLDYSILEIHGWNAARCFLLCIFLARICFGISIGGADRWIRILMVNISISEIMLLYVPLFGAALYSFRGEGYQVLWKIALLIILPVIFVGSIPDLSSAFILFTCLFCLFIFAVYKNWYQIHRKLILSVSGIFVLLSPVTLLGYLYFFGEEYQAARIRAFFTHTGDVHFFVSLARNMRESSALIGSSATSLELFTGQPASYFMTDYVIVSMCGIYGILLTIAILTALLFLVMKIFQISTAQKNQLGMIVGTGCGIVFLSKIAVSILVNLQLIPYTSISMPFLSYGGSSIIVSYILLGLVLSIYRYKNILPDHREYRPHRRLKITWE